MAPETPPSRSLFITVGSTLFEALTTLCLSAPFLSALATAGVEDLVVQYGKAKLDLPPDLQVVKDEVDGSGEAIFRAGGGGGGGGGLGVKVRVRVRVMRYTDDFEGEVKRASWVISHAGSGSILTALRAHKPLLVVPNTSLMDNHQAQLALALESGGYLTVSTPEGLINALPAFLDDSSGPQREPFPEVQKGRFASILDETAGYIG